MTTITNCTAPTACHHQGSLLRAGLCYRRVVPLNVGLMEMSEECPKQLLLITGIISRPLSENFLLLGGEKW